LLSDPVKLQAMGEKARTLAHKDAAGEMAEMVFKLGNRVQA
jgi:UDP-N-acetylglucosamine:LPS N-acetylglucosamine transferase